MCNLPNEHTPIVGEGGWGTLNPNIIMSSLFIEFGYDNTIGVFFEELLKSRVQGYELALCPLDFSSWPIERMHMLFYTC